MDQNVVIHDADPADADRIVSYMVEVLAEPNVFLRSTPEEFQAAARSEADFIRRCNEAPNSLFLIAEAGGELVGQLTLQGGTRRAEYHAAELGMTVARGWRNRGIGRRLLETAIARARDLDVLRRIELTVYVPNTPAIHLYEQLGFEIEGRRRKTLYRDGQYHDDYVMALLL